MLELLQTIFAGLSFLVFVVTATIALVQLRALRLSYQVTTASAVLEMYWTPQFQSWMHYVFYDLEEHMESPQFRAELGRVPADKVRHPEIYVCEYYALIGAYFKMGLIPNNIFLENGSTDAVIAWRRLRNVVGIMRDADTPGLYRDFEDLAARCEQYRAAPK